MINFGASCDNKIRNKSHNGASVIGICVRIGDGFGDRIDVGFGNRIDDGFGDRIDDGFSDRIDNRSSDRIDDGFCDELIMDSVTN